jgi:hypothetical protein
MNVNNEQKLKQIMKQKPSAYRSMHIARLRGETSNKTNKNKNKNELEKWILARWQNLTARLTDGDKFYKCGEKGKNQKLLGLPSVCRPSIKIDETTPSPLASELTDKQIKKAIKIKQQKTKNRINWKEL